jgi:3D (Asp-Asp-Asp) domain-containing protein
MEIKIVKEKEPELKFKKELDVLIHKRAYLSPKKVMRAPFQAKPDADILGGRKRAGHKSVGIEPPDIDADGRILNGEKGRKENQIKASGVRDTIPQDRMTVPLIKNARLDGNVNSSRIKDHYRRNKITKSAYDTKQKQSLKKELAVKGIKQGQAAILTQMDGGEEVNEAWHVVETAARPAKSAAEKQKFRQAERRLKIKQADGKITSKEFQKGVKASKKKIGEKQNNQAIRQRKLQYVIHKLTGSGEQDSLLQTVKDIVKMKASFVMLKAAKFMGVLLAPLFGVLITVALPVVLIMVLLYASPLAAFMPSPSEENPAVRTVLSEYYMEFNQELSDQAGDTGAITYLHNDNGNYVSNYMDTLMVYMVKYGTGEMGIDMDAAHKRYLKEVFDEMNSFANTTVTTTMQAGQSLGNVVTSGYCQCSICCGQWAGGPTASGAMPTADHTLAVDASNPFVPMGTKIIMNGIEYTVEDTGNFDQYGVQFDVFFADHTTASNWGHKTFEAFLAEGDENTVTVTRTGFHVKNLTYEDYIALGTLTDEQEELLREVMSDEFRSEIPSFGVGSDVANMALTKVGCQYSQDLRYEEGYYDCSSLVLRLYREFGIELPYIASTQGEYIVQHGLEVTVDELEPGDLIFYSYENNGQYRNISHVAIYIGNGRMVHAANTKRGVVNDPLIPSNIGLYGRPSMGQ